MTRKEGEGEEEEAAAGGEDGEEEKEDPTHTWGAHQGEAKSGDEEEKEEALRA